MSENNDLALVLFDEIEKAAASMTRLLLGVLDKAVLRLGDNSTVNFEKTLIFLTSNLGAKAMLKEICPDFGFAAAAPMERRGLQRKLESIGTAAVRRKFSPEFVNRIDAMITYQPLSSASLAAILDQQMYDLERHIQRQLAERAFRIELTDSARAWLLRTGTSEEYGARELKRTIHRHLMQPLASLVVSGAVRPGQVVEVETAADGRTLVLTRKI
jgi:ATP-dependent Clp protease ATP-binding subunit ClpA